MTKPTEPLIVTGVTIAGFFLSCGISIIAATMYVGDVKADVKVNTNSIVKVEKRNNTLYHLEAQKDVNILGELRLMNATLVEVKTKVDLLMEER